MRLFAGRRTPRPCRGSLALLTLAHAVAFCLGAPARAAGQEPDLRWDGYFEVVSGRLDSAPPTWTPAQPANGPSRMSRHPISGDGRYVVFDSDATSLAYYGPALYRRDRQTGQTNVLIGGPAREAAISADGNHVAFQMCEPYMRPDSASICDAWALDLRTWTWSLLSGTADGTFGNADSTGPVLSANGRFAVFVSVASNLTGAVGTRHVVLRDRDPDGNGVYDEPGTAVLETISAGGDADSDTPEVSDDGRFVAFRSLAATLVAGDTNGAWDVFLRDREAADTRRLNVGPQGGQSLASIDEPQISMSADGRFVAFSSVDGLLAPSALDDTNGVRDVFVYDRQASTLSRVDVGRAADAPALGNRPSGWPTLTGEGRYVVVESAATNVAVPPAGDSTQVYVVDRVTGLATRVSHAPDGSNNTVSSGRPSISGDGTVVLFMSAASFAGVTPTGYEQVYSAVHLSISPAEVVVPTRGGEAEFTVTTQQHTLWWPWWDTSDGWLLPVYGVTGVGSGTLRFQVSQSNPQPVRRSTVVLIGDASATVTQEAGLGLTSVSPASGPAEGGTLVTLTGTGFEPDMMVAFGGSMPAAFEYVDATTVRVIAPPSPFGGSEPHRTPVAISTSDGRFAWLDDAFEYAGVLDTTPPMVMGWAAGPEGLNGWFVGDVTITWGAFDPESPITSAPCATVVVSADTAGTTYTCTATSNGGAATATVTVRRDTTPPVLMVTSPTAQQLVPLAGVLTSTFACADSTSGVFDCGGAAPTGQLLDTSTPGWHTFAASATDAAGNFTAVTREYVVSAGTCHAPMAGLKYWARFEDDLRDSSAHLQYGTLSNMQYSFGSGIVGRAFYFPTRPYGFMDEYHGPAGALDFTDAMSATFWIRPESTGLATLLENAQQFRIDREPDGAIRWTVYGVDRSVEGTGLSTTRTALYAWSHVAFTYSSGEVKLYVNGRLEGVWTLATTTLNAVPAPSGDWLMIGAKGPWSATNYYVGGYDELQVLDRVLEPGEVEATFLSFGSGTCPPAATVFTIPEITVPWDAGTLPIRVTLKTVGGAPAAGRTIKITTSVVQPSSPFLTIMAVTDENGVARWDAPLDARPAIYGSGIWASWSGDVNYLQSNSGYTRVTVQALPTHVTWNAPAPVTYGTPLGAGQLNATADVPGTFSYSPALGTVLAAGSRVLGTTFTPTSNGYTTVTANVTLEVRKATPVMSVTAGTFSHDGLTHPATASARDYRGVALSPVTITYNGVTGAPAAVGVYAVVASFPGDANHEAATATGTLTITKATPAIAFSAPTSFTYDGQPHGVTASVTGLAGVSLGTVPVTYDGGASVPVDAGTYVVSATFAGDATYQARTVTTTLTIAKATPTIVFAPQPATFTYDGQSHGVTATVTGVGGANLGSVAVTYNGSAAEPVDAGSYTASASFAGSANYASRSQVTVVTIQKATPWIAFTPQPPTFTYDGLPHALTATVTGAGGASLGTLAVTYNGSANAPVNVGSYTASATFAGTANYVSRTGTTTLTIAGAVPVVTISGGPFVYDGQVHPATVTVTGVDGQTPAGTVTVTYNGSVAQPVNAGTYSVNVSVAAAGNYTATSASGSVIVGPATPAITWMAPDPITYGTALTGLQLRAGTHVPGTWSYSPAAGTVLDASPAQTLNVTFTPSNPNYTAATATTTIEVRKAVPSVGAAFYNVFYDGQPHPASASARGVNWELLEPITVTYNGSTEVPVNAGVYVIVTSYPGSANYEAASATMTREIYRTSVSNMTWLGPGTLIYGTPLGPSQFQTTASVPGTFAFTPGPGAVLDAGTHTITATFTPTDPNYNVATMTNTVTIVQATPSITVTAGTFTYDGQPHPAVATVTGAGGAVLVPVTITYNGSTAAPVAAGTYAVVAAFAGNTNYRAVSRNATLTIGKAPASLSWSAPTAIGYGTPLGAAQLNATANVPGTFVYAPAAGTVLGAGAGQPLSATFTPADPANYTGGAVGTAISVVPAPLTVRANDAAKVYGAPVPGFTASFAGLVAGDTPAALGGALAFATAATSSSPVGTYAVTPAGLSSPNYAISFVSGVLSVVRAPVAMTVTASPTPSGLDMPITFNATVAAAQSAPTAPDGTVRFFDGATLLGTATLSGGTATLLTGGLATGSHTIEARYDGDASFDVGAQTATHVVNTAAATPAITIASSRQPAATGQSVTFTATITVATSGTIAFYDGGTLLGSGSIAAGRATLTTSSLGAGSHAITARFQGNGSAPPVISPVFVQSVTAGGSWKDRTSTTSLVSSASPSTLGTTVTLTATVSGSSGAPAGRILFMVDGLVVGDPTGVAATAISSSASQATLAVPALAGGRHKVTATYLGSSNYRGSNGALTQTVN